MTPSTKSFLGLRGFSGGVTQVLRALSGHPHERRARRSDEAHVALRLFLAALCQREGVEALAVTTEDGFLLAAVGQTDLEWMGALGASARRATFTWDDRAIHVQRIEVNGVAMFVTSAGKKVSATAVQAGFARILKPE